MLNCFNSRFKTISSTQAAAIVAAIAFLLYLPALQFQFVNWDDVGYVTSNEAFAYHWRDFLSWAFTTFQQGNWHPLTWISLKIDHSLWALNPLGYHLTNIVLHAGNSFLVVVLMWRLFRLGTGEGSVSRVLAFAFTVGLIFAVHPLHVESVAWVSERKDLLYAFFYLLSILSWIAWTQRPGSKNFSIYMLSFLLFVLSLMSKPMAVSIPVVLVLLDIYPLRRTNLGFQIFLEKIPFIAVTLVSCVITILAQSKAQSVAPLVDLSLLDRLGNAARALFFYLYKGLVPVDLSPLYQLRVSDTSLMVQGVTAAFGFMVLLWLAIIRLNKSRIYFVLIAIFTAMLLPTLGIVQVGSQFAADRYMYLPILPLAVGVYLLVAQLGRKLSVQAAWHFLPAVVAGLVLALLTYQQTMHWRNSELLWKKVLAEDYAVPTAHYNLGNYYLSIDQLDKAEPEWLATIQLDPDYSWAHNQLGNVRLLRGDLNAALGSYQKAVASNPENFEARYNCARLLDQLGMIEKARDAYARFVELATPEYQEQIEQALIRIKQIGSVKQP